MSNDPSPKPAGVLAKAQGGLIAVGVFSLFTNLLLLTIPMYMLQVFDRVLSGRSLDTLLLLSMAALGALLMQVLVDSARGKILQRIGAKLEVELSAPALAATLAQAARSRGGTAQAMRDLAELRQAAGSPAMLSFFDLPWAPLFLVIIFMLHPILGWMTLIGAVLLFLIALANLVLTTRAHRRANEDAIGALERVQDWVDHADVLQAMGMTRNVVGAWQDRVLTTLDLSARIAGISSTLLTLSKGLRLVMQIVILGVGAMLVLQNQLTAGGMIAASIIMARALAPAEQAVGAWRLFASALAAWGRLNTALADHRQRETSVPLSGVEGRLTLDRVSYAITGMRAPIVRGVSVTVEPGEAVGIIGPSGSGKSTLARLMVGILEPTTGEVRLDGADVAGWDKVDLGQHIGYLPQDVQLFAGTVFDNIARMNAGGSEAVARAAAAAGVEDLVVHLPDGWETPLGRSGVTLSGGQQQRIALARALFGDPALLVLDEPDSNLDPTGVEALTRVLETRKADHRTVVVITHRPGILRALDRLILMRDGMIEMDGPRDDVLTHLGQPRLATAPPAEPAGPESVADRTVPPLRLADTTPLHPMPKKLWPDADQSAWQTVLQGLKGTGSEAHPMIDSACRAYGLWLAWMDERGLLAAPTAPADRLAPKYLRAFAARLKDSLPSDQSQEEWSTLTAVFDLLEPAQAWRAALQTDLKAAGERA